MLRRLAAVWVLATAGSLLGLRAQTLVVHVENLRSDVGSIHLGFYDSPAQWDTKKSNFQRHRQKGALVRGGRVTYTITDVAPGRYAMALADDENGNGEIDWGLILPKEGFGFSGYASNRLRRPDFEEFDFELREGETVEVVMRVRYL